MKDPQPATHAVYIDLGSLYATSGESGEQSRCDVIAGLVLQAVALFGLAFGVGWVLALLF